mmetsp:Transcript_5144/g.7623  ORF Transcript_5144/g.7623 Transcript_5144/m.7623 type:complete len:757 (+) Transcript_5144:64-2334(+)
MSHSPKNATTLYKTVLSPFKKEDVVSSPKSDTTTTKLNQKPQSKFDKVVYICGKFPLIVKLGVMVCSPILLSLILFFIALIILLEYNRINYIWREEIRLIKDINGVFKDIRVEYNNSIIYMRNQSNSHLQAYETSVTKTLEQISTFKSNIDTFGIGDYSIDHKQAIVSKFDSIKNIQQRLRSNSTTLYENIEEYSVLTSAYFEFLEYMKFKEAQVKIQTELYNYIVVLKLHFAILNMEMSLKGPLFESNKFVNNQDILSFISNLGRYRAEYASFNNTKTDFQDILTNITKMVPLGKDPTMNLLFDIGYKIDKPFDTIIAESGYTINKTEFYQQNVRQLCRTISKAKEVYLTKFENAVYKYYNDQMIWLTSMLISFLVAFCVTLIFFVSMSCTVYLPHKKSLREKNMEIDLSSRVADLLAKLELDDELVQEIAQSYPHELTIIQQKLRLIVLNFMEFIPYIPPSLIQSIKTGEEPVEETTLSEMESILPNTQSIENTLKLKNISLLLIQLDIKNIYDLDLADIHTDVISLILKICKRYCAIFHGFSGETYLISFNSISTCFDHEKRASFMALEFKRLYLKTFSNWSSEAKVRMMVVSDEMKIGNIGNDLFKSYAFFSRSFSNAMKIIKYNAPEDQPGSCQIFINEEVYSKVKLYFTAEIIDIITLTHEMYPIKVIELMDKKSEKVEEWMYEVKHLENQSKDFEDQIEMAWNYLAQSLFDQARDESEILEEKGATIQNLKNRLKRVNFKEPYENPLYL